MEGGEIEAGNLQALRNPTLRTLCPRRKQQAKAAFSSRVGERQPQSDIEPRHGDGDFFSREHDYPASKYTT